jgi:hypothetical protein
MVPVLTLWVEFSGNAAAGQWKMTMMLSKVSMQCEEVELKA